MLDHLAKIYEKLCDILSIVFLVLGGVLGVLIGWKLGSGIDDFILIIFGLIIGVGSAYIFDVVLFGTISQIILMRKYTQEAEERLEKIEELLKSK